VVITAITEAESVSSRVPTPNETLRLRLCCKASRQAYESSRIQAVIGLSMGHTLQISLLINALQQALVRRKPTQALCHHSNKGCQYTSITFQSPLTQQDITCSRCSSENCYDNAVAESFFHTLKTECVYDEQYQTRDHAKSSSFEYVEVFYNNQRRHSTLSYVSPTKFERLYQRQNFRL